MAGPEITVVIPAFERISALEGCLHALAAQTLPPSEFEVIVWGDGSRLPVRDALTSTLGALADRLHVRVIRRNNGGPAAARNRGAGEGLGGFSSTFKRAAGEDYDPKARQAVESS